jgi:hypothetical protein
MNLTLNLNLNYWQQASKLIQLPPVDRFEVKPEVEHSFDEFRQAS